MGHAAARPGLFATSHEPARKSFQQPIDENGLFCKLMMMQCIMIVNF
jgi:hypothetical protein